MPDWSRSMQQTFEYYIVNPDTWKDDRKINTVRSCEITRDGDAETLGSATLDITESIGECYVRVYLITIQNGVKEKHPLGTFLVQTPSFSFDGKIQTISTDVYTPLLELKENPPPFGYYVAKKENIMDVAYRLIREHARAPVIKTDCDEELYSDFVANINETWLTFISDLISNAKHSLALDELGRILFSPNQDTASLQPVWTYDDSNSSILLPEIDLDHDLYGIPNVVEVIYSDGNEYYYARVVNDDPNSPISTVNRGREITYRETNPSFIGDPTDNKIQESAKQLLRNLSTLEYTVTYKHGYCPTRLGDCVRLNYERAGITDVKAKVINQTIECRPGCTVTEKAIFTKRLWG